MGLHRSHTGWQFEYGIVVSVLGAVIVTESFVVHPYWEIDSASQNNHQSVSRGVNEA